MPGMEAFIWLAVAAVALVVVVGPHVLLVVSIIRAMRRRRLRPSAALLTPGVLTAVSLIALLYAAGTWVFGVFTSGPFGDVDDGCFAEADAAGIRPGPNATVIDVADSLLPLRHVCVFSDGSHVETVLWWVNPLLFAWLAIMVGALLAMPLGRLISRREAAVRALS